jgi:hypothetical protein
VTSSNLSFRDSLSNDLCNDGVKGCNMPGKEIAEPSSSAPGNGKRSFVYLVVYLFNFPCVNPVHQEIPVRVSVRIKGLYLLGFL